MRKGPGKMFVDHLHGGHAPTDDALLGGEVVVDNPGPQVTLAGLDLDFAVNQALEQGIYFFLG